MEELEKLRDSIWEAGLSYVKKFGIGSHPPTAFLIVNKEKGLAAGMLQFQGPDKIQIAGTLFEAVLAEEPVAVIYLTETHFTQPPLKAKRVSQDPSSVDGFAGIFITAEKIFFRNVTLKETEKVRVKVTDDTGWFDIEGEDTKMVGFFIIVAKALREAMRAQEELKKMWGEAYGKVVQGE